MILTASMDIERNGLNEVVELSGYLVKGARATDTEPPEPDEVVNIQSSKGCYLVDLTPDEYAEAERILLETGESYD